MYTYGIKAHHVYLEVEKIVPRACFELAWLSLLARLLPNTFDFPSYRLGRKT